MNIFSRQIQWSAMLAAGLIVGTAPAGAHGQDPGVEVNLVSAWKLANVPGRILTAVTVNYAPGAKSSAHHHAGSVFAFVLTGTIRSENSATGPVGIYKAGESFFEPEGSKHLISENASATVPASLLAVFIADDGADLTTIDSPSPDPVKPDPRTADLAGVQHKMIAVNGVTLHYAVTGEGEPVVLVPGWPESWFAWRRVIPELLRAGRRVYVIDPRGFGDSGKPHSRYDPVTAAKDLHAFIETLDLAQGGGVDIVTHGVGSWMGYAHATTFPRDVRRLILSEAAIPGVSSALGEHTGSPTDVRPWPPGFNHLDGLLELLVKGHEREYLNRVFEHGTLRKDAIEPAAFDEYMRLFSNPDNLRAGFAWYRDFLDEAGLAQAKEEATHRLTMPVLALGGEGGVGGALLKTLQPLGDHVSGEVIAGCGHYLPEECPDEFTRLILKFWKENPPAAK